MVSSALGHGDEGGISKSGVGERDGVFSLIGLTERSVSRRVAGVEVGEYGGDEYASLEGFVFVGVTESCTDCSVPAVGVTVGGAAGGVCGELGAIVAVAAAVVGKVSAVIVELGDSGGGGASGDSDDVWTGDDCGGNC